MLAALGNPNMLLETHRMVPSFAPVAALASGLVLAACTVDRRNVDVAALSTGDAQPSTEVPRVNGSAPELADSGNEAVPRPALPAGAGASVALADAGAPPDTAPPDAGAPVVVVAGAKLGPALTITGVQVVDLDGTSRISGDVYTVQSPLGTRLELLMDRSAELCLRGSEAPVPNGDYSNYWGVELTLELNQARDGSGAALAWDPAPGKVIGLAFRTTGAALPGALTVRAQPTGTDAATQSFCHDVDVSTGPRYEVRWDEIRLSCFDAPNGQPISDYPTLQTLTWTIPASETQAYSFDFCITDLQPLLAE
jgi:hypothetical protein